MADENTQAPAQVEANPFAQAPATGAPPAAPANAAPAAEDAQTPPAQEQAPASNLVTPPPTQVEEVISVDAGDGKVEYEATGDAGLDVALSFIGNLGIAGNDPAVVAAANGDFTFLEAKLATLGEKSSGWQQIIALAKDAYSRAGEKYKQHIEAVDKAVLSVAGSKENWDTVASWAKENATPEEKKAINQMIDAGPVQARAAASLLLSAYKTATGTTVAPASVTRKNASGESPTAESGRLSQTDYATEVRKLHNKLGTRMETGPEYAALKRRLTR